MSRKTSDDEHAALTFGLILDLLTLEDEELTAEQARAQLEAEGVDVKAATERLFARLRAEGHLSD